MIPGSNLLSLEQIPHLVAYTDSSHRVERLFFNFFFFYHLSIVLLAPYRFSLQGYAEKRDEDRSGVGRDGDWDECSAT